MATRAAFLVSTTFVLLAGQQVNAQGATPASAPAKAAQCVACHGPNGMSLNPLWPNLAGQKKDYLIKQLNDFKNDRRQDPLMTPQAKTLSAADIEQLSLYFSELK